MPPRAQARARDNLAARGRGPGAGALAGRGLGRGGRGRAILAGRGRQDAAAVSNARKARRKAAVRELNVLAAEMELPSISVKKHRAVDVEQQAHAERR